MSDGAATHPVMLAQLQISPSLPEPSMPKPALPQPSAPSASGGLGISPSLPQPSSSGISPSLPGSGPAPAMPSSAPSGSVSGSGSNLNITITNPDKLPSLPPGQHELKLVIQDQSHASSASSGIGFVEIFIAIVAALLVAPFVQREAGKWSANLNALRFVQKNGIAISTYLLVFTIGWIVFLIILPQLYMFDFSFRHNLNPSEVGTSVDTYTLKNYKYLIFGREGSDEMLNWLHLQVFIKTIIASVIVTLINFALCYPLAFFMAQMVRGRSQRLLFLCLLLPFWVNEILRAFAFKIIFADKGLVNAALIALGIFDQPYDFLSANVALYTGLTYAYILLMIFPLYNAIESLDPNQIEAARDMGASWIKIHRRVVMPHAKPGIASGCTMVFMLTAGALAAPNILGGPSSLWFTQIIYQWYNTGGNWPQGSAYAFILLISCIIFVRIMMRVFKVGLGDIAKR
ncbi:MAG: ABC transporter permease [Rhodospirillales bacterium]|jgi:spermidine/putrescine transport system permease protein|nr:ABC transporter permease [Rhodospirillales bacterium]